jgi:hypothetical protein
MTVSFIKLRRFCFKISKLFRLLLCASQLVCAVLVTTLPSLCGFDNVDFKLLNLQNKKAIPNLVTIEMNNCTLYMYENPILKERNGA